MTEPAGWVSLEGVILRGAYDGEARLAHHRSSRYWAKLAAYQKVIKAFLIHRLRRSTYKDAIDEYIRVYVDWHNNGLKVRTTGCYPEERVPRPEIHTGTRGS
jgi:hypothetical protein